MESVRKYDKVGGSMTNSTTGVMVYWKRRIERRFERRFVRRFERRFEKV